MPDTKPQPATEPTPAERRSWMQWTELWVVLSGVSALITALTTLGAVIVGLNQLKEARELTLHDSAYASWNQLTAISIEHPELACPDTDAKFASLMGTVDPKLTGGATYRDRYAAYGTLMITTSEQILEMAPRDPYWRFRIEEQLRCNAPAIRFLMHDGSYNQRYSCRLREVIAETMKSPAPACRDED
jgi:hypothetical protein